MKIKEMLSKKVTIAGKAIPVFLVVSILSVGLGSAALVGYISNTITAEIEVSSPMLAGISLGRDSWSTTQCYNKVLTDPNYNKLVDSFPECDVPVISDWAEGNWKTTLSINTHGGESLTIYTMSKNLANAEISGYEEAIVTNLDGVTCDDFESVVVRVDSIYGSLGYGRENNALDICVQNGFYEVKFDSESVADDKGLSTWGAGETDVSKMVVTFKTNALGTYTFTYRVVPVSD